MDNRYQYQNNFVKYYRWLKYRPLSIVCFIVFVIVWFIKGAKIPDEERVWFSNRGEFIYHVWFVHKSICEMKMEYYYTLDEVFKDLKNA